MFLLSSCSDRQAFQITSKSSEVACTHHQVFSSHFWTNLCLLPRFLRFTQCAIVSKICLSLGLFLDYSFSELNIFKSLTLFFKKNTKNKKILILSHFFYPKIKFTNPLSFFSLLLIK